MLNPGYTSIERVIENVIRDTGFTDEIYFPDMVEWCFIAMELIGVPSAYIQSVTDGDTARGHQPPIEIIDYRGELPCDFHKLISIREYCNKLPLVHDSGTFLQSINQKDANFYSNLTYKINNNYIFTNMKEGQLEMSYWSFPTDEAGLPMIPDDVKYIRAVESFLSFKIATKLWLQDKLTTDKKNYFEQSWYWDAKAAKGKADMVTYDMAESLKNQILRLVQRPNQASWNYAALNNPEKAYVGRNRRMSIPSIGTYGNNVIEVNPAVTTP